MILNLYGTNSNKLLWNFKNYFIVAKYIYKFAILTIF